MTLGGLALAVGILVDDATVTIENINWHLEQGKPIQAAILDGARQIVAPAFVSLICICIVFVPMFFFPGVSGFLFAPMAEAVVFAMIASFVLSRTLVPAMANYLLVGACRRHTSTVMREHDAEAGHQPTRNPLSCSSTASRCGFERVRTGYRDILMLALGHAGIFIVGLPGCGAGVLRAGAVPWPRTSFPPSIRARSTCMCARPSARESKRPPPCSTTSRRRSGR